MKKIKNILLLTAVFVGIKTVDAAVCMPSTQLTNPGYGKLVTKGHYFDVGTEYKCNPGDGKIRTFYVISSDQNNVEMIADRNLGNTRVAFVTKSDYKKMGGTDFNWQVKPIAYGAQTAQKYLEKKTKNWKEVTVSLPTLPIISKVNGDVVTKIVNGNYTLTKNEMILNNIFYSNLATVEVTKTNTGYNYGLVSSMYEKGKYIATIPGYWLNDSWMFNDNGVVTSKAYQVLKMSYKNKTTGGRIATSANLSSTANVGVRPVITVSKSKISR